VWGKTLIHYLHWTGLGDIYMDMRLGLTEVTMLFMVFGSLKTRRKPCLCSPSDDSVTAHNTLHTHIKHRAQHRVGLARTLLHICNYQFTCITEQDDELPNMRCKGKGNT